MVAIEGEALFVKGIFEFLSAFVVVLGVPTAIYKFNRQWATRYMSNIAMDAGEMGYFMARTRCWLVSVLLMHIPTVQVPRVPSLGTMISAGDDGLWTSAMLLGRRALEGKFKEPIVTWVTMYEAFFREYAWASDRREFEKVKSSSEPDGWKSVIDSSNMKRYKEEAEFGVWMLKRMASKEPRDQNWPTEGLRLWCIRHILYPIDRLWHSMVRAISGFLYRHNILKKRCARLTRQLDVVDVELEAIPFVDRHLLYYPWMIHGNRHGEDRAKNLVSAQSREGIEFRDCEKATPSSTDRLPKEIQPTLVSCIRSLPDLDHISESLFYRPRRERTGIGGRGDEKGQRLGLFNHIPAVNLSDDDLAALWMMLLIERHGMKGRSRIRGAVGHLFNWHQETGMQIIRLGYYDQTRFTNTRPAGSGYSTLFAKHLACGCIPFARSPEAQGIRTLHTLPITIGVEHLIKRGAPVSDDTSPTERSLWDYRAIQFLQAMPRDTTINYYHREYDSKKNSDPHSDTGLTQRHDTSITCQGASKLVSERAFVSKIATHNPNGGAGITQNAAARAAARNNSMGSLYHVDSRFGKPISFASWWHVVAGIAFGGLVPMTTRGVVNLVTFSVGGALETGRGIEDFKPLMKVVLSHLSAQPYGSEDIGGLVFGKKTVQQLDLLSQGISVDFRSDVFGTGGNSTRGITMKLACLATLLEALVAMVDEGADRFPCDLPATMDDWFTAGQRKRQVVYEACAAQIQRSYNIAVEAHISGKEQPHDEIQHLLGNLHILGANEHKITTDECGTVARCIIMAWAGLVRIVEWTDDVDKGREEEEVAEDRTRAFRLMRPEEFPDVVLWE